MFRGRRFVETHDYPFHILFDETRKVTKDYGVYNVLGIDAFRITHPAVFFIDDEGTILWIGVSSSQANTLSPEDILRIIEVVGRY